MVPHDSKSDLPLLALVIVLKVTLPAKYGKSTHVDMFSYCVET